MSHRRSNEYLHVVDKGARVVDEAKDETRFLALDDACRALSASFNAGILCIVVGAGMSKPYGIPDWTTLVEKLFNSYLTEHYFEPTPELLKYLGSNPIVQIRLLRRLYKVKAAFLADLCTAMYASFSPPAATVALDQLARLLVRSYKRGRPVKVITYNFDSLLEDAIAVVDPSVPISSVSLHAQACSPQEGIRVFHPHGYLPRGSQASGTHAVVFSEDEFHALMSDNAHWANVLQLEAFQNSTCLFVGTSLTDPNVRRLLDRCRQGLSPRHWVARTFPSSAPNPGWICRLLSEEMASLGVSILGLKSYDELSILFERLAPP